MQAQQNEYVASLLEKVALLKDNVSEGKRLQDLLCRERDQLREALEVRLFWPFLPLYRFF
jgi:hypothetical protein